jgi:hypothetical protein
LIGFGQHCSSDNFSLRCVFGRDHLARSHVVYVTHAGFGSSDPHRSALPRLIRRFGNGQLNVCGARSSCLASVFGKFATALPSLASGPPNKSFKPTPHRGVNSVLYATLHAVATPLRGGLTPALGGSNP